MKRFTTYLLWLFLILIALSCEKDELIFPDEQQEKSQSIIDVCFPKIKGMPPILIDTCQIQPNWVRVEKDSALTKSLPPLDSLHLFTGPQLRSLLESGSLIIIGNSPQLMQGDIRVMKSSYVPHNSAYAWEMDYYLDLITFLRLDIEIHPTFGNVVDHMNIQNGSPIDGFVGTWQINNSNFITDIVSNDGTNYDNLNWGQVLWLGNQYPQFLIILQDNITHVIWHVLLKLN